MGLFREFGNPLAAVRQNRRKQAEILREGLAAVTREDQAEAVRSLAQLNDKDRKRLGSRMAYHSATHDDGEGITGVVLLSGLGQEANTKFHYIRLLRQQHDPRYQSREQQDRIEKDIRTLEAQMGQKKRKRRL